MHHTSSCNADFHKGNISSHHMSSDRRKHKNLSVDSVHVRIGVVIPNIVAQSDVIHFLISTNMRSNPRVRSHDRQLDTLNGKGPATSDWKP